MVISERTTVSSLIDQTCFQPLGPFSFGIAEWGNRVVFLVPEAWVSLGVVSLRQGWTRGRGNAVCKCRWGLVSYVRI